MPYEAVCGIKFEGYIPANGCGPLATQALRMPEMVEPTLHVTTRICTCCRQRKIVAEFSPKPRKKDEASNQCRDCVGLRKKKWVEERKALFAERLIDPDAIVRCPSCSQHKTAENFPLSKTTRTGRAKACFSCVRRWDRARYAADPDLYKEKAKRSNLKKIHGLTKNEWLGKFTTQDGKCAICENVLAEWHNRTRGAQRACVDHDHGTGKIRGLLCPRCNQGLGLFLENPASLQRAILYLEVHRK